MLLIHSTEYESIRRHGEETYPHECCGVLLGKLEGATRTVKAAVRCVNTRQDSPQNRYNIDPRELITIQRRGAERGLDIVGFYHSHPDHPPQWSSEDLAQAHWVGCSYVITCVKRGSAHITNSFALLGESDDDKHFEKEEISLLAAVEDQSICR